MKRLNKFWLRFGAPLCSLAMFVAIHFANTPSDWKYYEPEAPKGLERYKKVR